MEYKRVELVETEDSFPTLEGGGDADERCS